ncbi:DUF222 domain-containing protein [Nocardioides sp.]|uniref:HNH endonuclease signature motif containing protein n=1 Tax=Nocardioides sp. TaxID=35761 RepID=UPI003D10CA65
MTSAAISAPTQPSTVLARVRAARRAADAAEVEVLVGAAEWADSHPTPPNSAGALGDLLVPDLDWDAPAEFAAALGMSTGAGTRLIHHALELRHRLPRLWARLLAGEVQVWRARRIAERTLHHPDDVATGVDASLSAIAHRIGMLTVDRLIDEALIRLDPEEHELAQLEALDARYARLHEASINHTGIAEMTLRAEWKDLKDFDDTLSEIAAALIPALAAQDVTESLDVRRAMAVGVLADPRTALDLLTQVRETARPARPRREMTLVVHLTDAALLGNDPVGRCQAAQGGTRPVLEAQVREWCARTDTFVRVQPVIDLNDHVHVDQYEVPDRLKTRLELFHHHCMFPWCTRPARSSDCDHVIPHGAGGATCDCNLAPLCRRHHRLKTLTRWTYTCIEPGAFLWTTPQGYRLLRDHTGTTDVTQRHPGRGTRRHRHRPRAPEPTGCHDVA